MSEFVSYINTFHDPMDDNSQPSILETDAVPVHYYGFDIYRRLPNCYDVVRDGLCLGMYAGLNGAKRSIDRGRYSIEASANQPEEPTHD